MDVTGLGTTSSAAAASQKPVGGLKSLDKDSFLMLLVAQLKNQDPSSTQDPNQMVQQITSFSSLETLQNNNKLLEGIQAQNLGIFQAQAAGMVGKMVKVASNQMDIKNGQVGVMGLDLAGRATSVTVTIKDKDNKIVKAMDLGSKPMGTTAVEWDGKDAKGNKMPDGTYTVEVKATDADGKEVQAATTSRLKVDSVVFADGVIYLMAGGHRFPLTSVNEVSA